MSRTAIRSSNRKAAMHTPTINSVLSLPAWTAAALVVCAAVIGGLVLTVVVVATAGWLTSRDAVVNENANLVLPSTSLATT